MVQVIRGNWQSWEIIQHANSSDIDGVREAIQIGRMPKISEYAAERYVEGSKSGGTETGTSQPTYRDRKGRK